MNDQVTVRFGLVHTVPALAPVFHDLVLDAVGEASQTVELIHATDPWLLRTAVTTGVTAEVTDRLVAHVRHLTSLGVDGVLVTCSSLGEATEETSRRVSAAPVVRIDQAMAERAVDLVGPGGRIVVLATLASTVGPTIRLVERSANDAGTGVGVDVRLLEEAGRAREAGDDDRHDALVTEGVDQAISDGAGVVVLAQASMARAVDSAAQRAVPVLASPELAAHRLVNLVRARS